MNPDEQDYFRALTNLVRTPQNAYLLIFRLPHKQHREDPPVAPGLESVPKSAAHGTISLNLELFAPNPPEAQNNSFTGKNRALDLLVPVQSRRQFYCPRFL